MSCWQNPMIKMLRSMIGDTDGTTYSDGDLQETLIYAAFMMHKRLSFVNSYTVNIPKLTISPDPIELADVDFVGIVTLKAGTEILLNELKTSSTNAVSWKNGPSSFDGKSAHEAKKEIYDLLKSQLDEATSNYQLGNVKGRSVMGPFSAEDLSYSWNGGFRWQTLSRN